MAAVAVAAAALSAAEVGNEANFDSSIVDVSVCPNIVPKVFTNSVPKGKMNVSNLQSTALL